MGDSARQGADAQIAGVRQGYSDLSSQFGQGRSALQSSYAAGLQPFMQNYGVAQGGQNAYADATGANGAAGNTRAVNNFQAGPGYQWNMDQQMQNLLRTQEATGQANSGATNADTLKLAHGIADQGWQSYVSNLAPFLSSANSAAGGIGQLNAGLGQGLNQSFANQGNAAYGAQTSIGNANANADLANYTASGNIWNTLLGFANAGAKYAGGKTA